MTCLAIESEFNLSRPSKWDLIRGGVFWGFILLVIVSPAILSALILLQG
ncbi:hypothetical protein LJR225_003371 [Phenylobacterium sp. LjRoot225]